MLAHKTILGPRFRDRHEALAPLIDALPRWKHIRGTLNSEGGELLCSAPSSGRSGAFCYPARVLLRTEPDASVSVELRLERVTTGEAVWLVLSLLFFPLLCAFPDARHLGLGVGLGLMSGLARGVFLFIGAERIVSDFERLYRSAGATASDAKNDS